METSRLLINNDQWAYPFGLPDTFYYDSENEKIIYGSEDNIKVYDLANSQEEMLDVGPIIPSTSSVPSPSGEWILYLSDDEEGNNLRGLDEVVLINLIRGNKYYLYLTQLTRIDNGVWMPDSRYFLAETDQGIYQIDINSREIVNLSRSTFPLTTIDEFIGFID